jgi:hypothetical protein
MGVTYNTSRGSDVFCVFVLSDGATRSARNHQQICRNHQESSEIISSLPLLRPRFAGQRPSGFTQKRSD